MKAILALAMIATLTGCAVVPVGYGYRDGYYGGRGYYRDYGDRYYGDRYYYRRNYDRGYWRDWDRGQ